MRFILILLIFLNLYAMQVSDIIKQIPKNSPNYSLAIILKNKIDDLRYTTPKINIEISNEKNYLTAFNNLVLILITKNSLLHEIDELNNKISFLTNKKDPISQLQYVYFTKLLNIKNKTLAYITEQLPSLEKKTYGYISKIDFDINQANKTILHLQKQLENLNKQFESLKINLQKYTLLNDKNKIKEINITIEKNNTIKQEIYKKLVNQYVIVWSSELKNKNKHAFKTDDNILIYAQKIDKNYFDALNKLITDFEHYTFGAKVLVYSAKREMSLFWNKVIGFINYPLFSVSNRIITPLNFAIFIFILILGWFIGKYYKYFIYRLKHRYDISHSTATLLANMGYYTIVTFTFLTALKVVGLDLSSLAIIAGALSVGIGFGLQNIVSNFVSGIILMFERSIKVGDYIQIDENTRGEVVDISMRSTVIRTNDNINLIIPNQSFIQNNVINWTLGDDIIRFRVPFGVAYGSDIDKVETVILNKLKNSNLPYIKQHKSLDVTPYVVFMEMADSSLNFELFIWVKGEYARRPRRTRSKFLKMIYNALNEAGINIPFPQQDLHIKDAVPLEIKIKK